MTHRTCRMFPKECGIAGNLPETTHIPVINRNAIAKINGRVFEDAELAMTAKEFDKLFSRGEENSDCTVESSIIKMSADVVAQLHCAKIGKNEETFSVIRDSDKLNQLRIKGIRSTEKSADAGVARKIGELAEKAVAIHTGEGRCVIQSRVKNRDSTRWQYCDRDTDAIGLNGRGEKEAIEIKCVGQLTMSKEYFFNKRLYPMVAKCIASRSLATYIVQRDDRETDLHNKYMPLLGIQYCEDITRLLPKEQFDKMLKTHLDLNEALHQNIKKVSKLEIIETKVTGTYVKVINNDKTYCAIRRLANIPSCSYSILKAKNHVNIVVGPDIPYFDYRNSDYYISYKYKFKFWGLQPHHKKIIVIANSFEDIKAIFEKFNRNHRNGKLEIISYTRNCLHQHERKYFEEIFHRQNDFEYHLFSDYDQLGGYLFERHLTYWRKPIPQLLILLGNGMSIPARLITARASWGTLTCNSAGDYETGLHFGTCPKPGSIVVIGSIEECQGAVRLLDKNEIFKGIHLFFPTVGPIWVRKGDRIIVCAPTELENRMEAVGLPMYKKFQFINGFWKAS